MGRDGAERALVFKESPVTIGRNALNDVTLDSEFVSAYHGMVDFVRDEVVYTDMRSTNGTEIDGDPVQQGIPISVGAQTRVSLGEYHIHLEWTDRIEQAPPRRLMTVGSTALPSAMKPRRESTRPQDPPPTAGARITTEEEVAPQDNARTEPVAVPPEGIAPEVARREQQVPRRDGDAAAGDGEPQAVRRAHEAYRRGWASLLAALRHEISSAEPARREIVAFHLVSEFPQVSLEPEFARMLKDLGVEQASLLCVDMDDWVARLTGAGSEEPTKVNYALVVERIGNIVGAFADALLNLRRGYHEARTELGLTIPHERGVLDQATDKSEVIRYLMALDEEQAETLDALRRTFAEFPRHQVALLSGVREGSRELLEQFSPEALGGQGSTASNSSALAARTQALLSRVARLWPVAPIVQWGRHTQRYEEAMEGDRFVKSLFGAKFREAYFQLMRSR